MSSFNVRFAAARQSYKNNGGAWLSLIIEAIDYAEENNHNPVYIQRVLDTMEGGDVDHMAVIVRAFAPFYVTDGQAKLHGKTKGRDYNVMIGASAFTSFRSLAMSLVPDSAAPKVFDVDRLALNFAKAMRKNGVVDSAAIAAVLNAFDKIDDDTQDKAIKDNVIYDARLAKAA